VRAAAVDVFLQDLKRKRSADLNGLLATLNDGSLCREALRFWLKKEWIVVAPFSPLVALAGPAFTRELTLHALCGEVEDAGEALAAEEPPDRTEAQGQTAGEDATQ
jgi:hypothetical protein